MKKFIIGRFEDDGKQWASLIVDNLETAMIAVRQLMGQKWIDSNLHNHALYNKTHHEFVTSSTCRMVYEDMYTKIMQHRRIVVNRNGGYITEDSVDWVLNEEVVYETNDEQTIHSILAEENGEEKTYKKVS